MAFTLALPDILQVKRALVLILFLLHDWILRKLMRKALRFGLFGPMGSLVVWMQSTFLGAAVPAGSWFGALQAVGMGVVPVWLGLMTHALLIGGLLFMFKYRPSAT